MIDGYVVFSHAIKAYFMSNGGWTRELLFAHVFTSTVEARVASSTDYSAETIYLPAVLSESSVGCRLIQIMEESGLSW